MPRAVRNADRVICVSRATARDAVGLLDVPYRKLRVIPNATEPVFSTPSRPAAARAAVPALRRHARAAQEPARAARGVHARAPRRAARAPRAGRRRRLGRCARRLHRGRRRVRPGRRHRAARPLRARRGARPAEPLGGLRTARRRGAGHGLPGGVLQHPGAARARRRGRDLLRSRRAPRRSPRASCTRSRSRGRRRAAARAGTTPPPRSSHSGASSCRERRSRSCWSTATPSGAGAPGTRATRSTCCASSRRAAPELSLACSLRDPADLPAGRAARRCAGCALDVASPYRRIPFAFPALARREAAALAHIALLRRAAPALPGRRDRARHLLRPRARAVLAARPLAPPLRARVACAAPRA